MTRILPFSPIMVNRGSPVRRAILSVDPMLIPVAAPTPVELAVADRLAWDHDRGDFTAEYPGPGWDDSLGAFDFAADYAPDEAAVDRWNALAAQSEAELVRVMIAAEADCRFAQGGVR